MNTFNEADHPRNKGKFTDKIQSVATVTLGNRLEDYTSPDRFVEMASTSAAYWQNYYGQKGKSVSVDVDDIGVSVLSLS
jgi:hypothetical protein